VTLATEHVLVREHDDEREMRAEELGGEPETQRETRRVDDLDDDERPSAFLEGVEEGARHALVGALVDGRFHRVEAR
jgi:hypothetical protein